MSKLIERPMNDDEKACLQALGFVRFSSASWDKRFYRTMAPRQTISEKAAPQIWRLFIRYRRQIPARYKHLMLVAQLFAAPDFHKQAAQERRKAEELEKYHAAMQNNPLTTVA